MKMVRPNISISRVCSKCGHSPSQNTITEYCASNYPGKIPNVCEKCDAILCEYRIILEKPSSLLEIYQPKESGNKFVAMHQCHNCKTVYQFYINKKEAMILQSSLKEVR